MLATGSVWRRDGVDRSGRLPLEGVEAMRVLTPDDIMGGAEPGPGPVVVYDDDGIYMAGVLADQLAAAGAEVTFVTPAAMVSPWSVNTLEQHRIQASLIAQGVALGLGRRLTRVHEGAVETACVYSGRTERTECATLVLVTERLPRDDLARALRARADEGLGLATIGDALAPGTIADAVFSGHLMAQDFQRPAAEVEAELFMREMPALPERHRAPALVRRSS